jgi:hypothetical protein
VSDYLRWQVLYAMVDGLAVEGPLRQRLAAIAKYMAPWVESSREEEPVLKAQMLEILQRLSQTVYRGDLACLPNSRRCGELDIDLFVGSVPPNLKCCSHLQISTRSE